MGLVKIALSSGVATRSAGIFFHRATRRAKGKIAEKMAVSAASATAGVAAEMAARQVGRVAEKQLDENNNSSERWSLIGMFVPDSALNAIGSFILQLNPISIAANAANLATNTVGAAAETAAGLASKRLASRIRMRRMNASKRYAKYARLGLSKKSHAKWSRRVGKAVDIGVAAAETFGIGGLNIAGRVGAKVTTKVAASGFRWMAKNAAKRAARETLKRSVGKTSLKVAAKAAI